MINEESRLADLFWEEGKLKDCPIIDMHAHGGNSGKSFMPAGDTKDMLDSMDRCNVVLTCTVGHKALAIGPEGSEEDLRLARKFNDHFRLYHIVYSNNMKPEDSLKRVDENRDMFIGFKFHPASYEVALSDDRHRPFWEYADENRMIVLCHTRDRKQFCDQKEVSRILDKYSNLVLLAGHSFNRDWESAAEMVREYPNLYLELTGTLNHNNGVDTLIEQGVSRKLLFGADLPWFSYHRSIGAVLSAEMTDEDRRNIFYRNAKNLLERFDWFNDFWQKKTGGIY